jgi:hypothetical protein
MLQLFYSRPATKICPLLPKEKLQVIECFRQCAILNVLPDFSQWWANKSTIPDLGMATMTQLLRDKQAESALVGELYNLFEERPSVWVDLEYVKR